jgi:hypothetical protein
MEPRVMAPSTKKVLAGVIGVAAVVVFLLLRGGDEGRVPAPAPAERTTAPSAAPSSVVLGAASDAALPGADAADITSGQGYDLGTAMSQTKKVAAARAALAAGDAQLALKEIQSYESFPAPLLLHEEITVLKIQALSKVGRRTDALALAMSTRGEPAFAPYQEQIEGVLLDAGLRQP